MHVSDKLLSIIAAILISLPTLAADNTYENGIDNFRSYIRLPQEKVYLHFDNTSYYQGDKIWFKAYIVLAPTNEATPLSQTLHVELLTPGGKVIDKQVLKITNGQCHGDFTLNQLPFYSGFYEIRAYTRYMRNFGDDIVFSRVFPVFDRPKKEGDYTQCRIMKNSDARYGTSRPVTRDEQNFGIRFYPEGGYLIAGLPTRVAFEIIGRDGNDHTHYEGIVKNSTSDSIITHFSALSDGRGYFTMTPLSDRTHYEAVINVNGKEQAFRLPEVRHDGVNISVDNTTSTDTATVTIRKRHDGTQKAIGVDFSSRGYTYASGEIMLDSVATLKINKHSAPTGVSTVTIYDSDGDIIADRMFFIHKSDHATVSIKTDKTTYLPTEKVTAELTVTDSDGQPVTTPLSVSVTDADNAIGYQPDILSSLLLTSDIKGYVTNPSQYFSQSNPDRHAQLDLLMMTQEWRRYPWKEDATGDQSGIPYLPKHGISVSGQVVSFVKGVPKSNVTISTMLSQKNAEDSIRQVFVDSYTTDSCGRFAFDCNIIGRWYLIMSTSENGKKKDYRILLDHISPKPRAYHAAERQVMTDTDATDGTPITTEYTSQDNDYYPESDQIRTVTQDGERLLSLNEVVVTAKRNTAEENIRRNRAGSVAYYNMSDEINQILDNGKYIGQNLLTILYDINSNFNRQISPNGEEELLYKGFKPLYVINYRTAYLADSLNYRNLYVESIKSIYISEDRSAKCKYADPMLTPALIDKYGCVVFIETDPDMPAPPGKGTRRVAIQGYSTPAEFYHVGYSVMPEENDYRRTLYWNPDLFTDANGKVKIEFYNNATCRKLSFDAQGITTDGLISTSSVR